LWVFFSVASLTSITRRLSVLPPPPPRRPEETHVELHIILLLTQQVDESARIITRNIVEFCP